MSAVAITPRTLGSFVASCLLLACGGDDAPASPRFEPPELGALPARAEERRCLVGVESGAPPPARLSETGCFTSVAPLVATDELVPFAVVSPLFSDETHKARWLAIPPGQRAEWADDGTLDVPLGSVLAKRFASDDGALELRFSVRAETGFVFFTYRFEGDDARLLEGQETTEFALPDGREAHYVFPARETCRTCHGEVGVLGPSVAQLAMAVRYDGVLQPQLDALTTLGLVAPRPAAVGMPSPLDVDAPLEARARAYLHANCGHCHRPGGFAPVGLTLDLRWSTPTEATQTVCVPTQFAATAGEGMRIDPAYPDASVIVRRMRALGGDFPGPMPPVGRSVVDEHAAQLVRDWAASLDAALCP
ncbi:MAG: hypothetical protein H6721_33130 [Sandaracinus sp.]|nr:hypothetical protein [Sandaracinus sp.]